MRLSSSLRLSVLVATAACRHLTIAAVILDGFFQIY